MEWNVGGSFRWSFSHSLILYYKRHAVIDSEKENRATLTSDEKREGPEKGSSDKTEPAGLSRSVI